MTDRVLEHLRRVASVPEVVGDRYVIEVEIGSGGMSIVYRANDIRLRRPVAVKLLDAAFTDTAPIEAFLLASLEHPGIVPVHDAGTLPDGRSYYVMQLVQGQGLEQFCAATTPLSARLRVFLRVCDAVAFAHSRGIVHRDLKPGNVMVGRFGQVLVLDWGIASSVTHGIQEVAAAGTPAYMAPECGASIEPRSDVFSLGRLLSDVMVTDRPRPLAAIAMRASANAPDSRYQSVEALAADVLNFLDHLPVGAYRESLYERAARFTARNSALLLLITSYILVRVALYLFRS